MFTNNVYVTVNDFPLHGTDSNGSEWIVNQTDGFLDGAPSTLATTQKIWSHGVFTNQPFYGGRVVSLEGYVRGTTAENAILSWDALKQALSLDTQDVTINWRGYKRLLRGKQSGQPLVEWFDRYTLKFSLEFTSNTPFLYSAGGALSGSTYLPHPNGGMTFPYVFEGDGTANLSTSWTGTPDASTSTLSQDGAVIATNLFPTQRPADGNTDNTTVTQTADGFTITTNTTYTGDGDNHNVYTVNTVAGETYHFHAEIDDVLTTTLPDVSVWVDGLGPFSNTYLSAPSVIDKDITTDNNTGFPRFSFKCGMTAGDHVTWRRIGLYTAADWSAMQALGVDWFDGDSYPVSWGFPEESTSGSITLNSHGTASSPVIITISGYVVNPRIEHRQTGAVLALDYTIPVGETVVLNSETREVLINGKIPSQQIVSSRQWFTARPGENTFMFFADDGNPDTATITVEMREAWL